MRPPPPLPAPDFLAGLDLGQVADFSALAVVERSWEAEPGTRRVLPTFAVRHLHRWPLGTSYPDIVRDVVELVRTQPLVNPALVVDATGVGRPIVDLLRAARPAARIKPVVITAGDTVTEDADGTARVPKRLLASTLQAALQTRRLRIAPLPERDTLAAELAAFTVKVNVATGNESFEAWRERDKDDTVLAVCLAVWLGSLPVNTARPAAYSGQGRPPGFEGALYGRGFGAAAAGSWRPPGAAGLPGGLPPLEPGDGA